MKTVYKYLITPQNSKIKMLQGAVIVCVHEQNGLIYIWAEVDTELPTEEREFAIYGTGENMPDEIFESFLYVGTVFIDKGALVYHVYERY